MSKYVVGYCDFFDADVKLEVVEAPTPNAAALKVLKNHDWLDEEEREMEDCSDEKMAEILNAIMDWSMSDPLLISE